MPSESDLLLVELALKNHLLSQQEADQALADVTANPAKDVASVLQEKGILQTRHVDSLKKKAVKILEERRASGSAAANDATKLGPGTGTGSGSRPTGSLGPPPDQVTHAAPTGVPGAAPLAPPLDLSAAIVFFGQIAAKQGFVTEDEVQQALTRQTQLDALGAKRRIGEILCDRKKLTPEQVRDVLAFQGKFIFACPKCLRRYNVSGSAQGAQTRCPACSVALQPASTLPSPSVVGSPSPGGGAGASRAPEAVANSLQQSVSPGPMTARRKPTELDPAGLLGTEFNGHLVAKVLGRGGMGCVYLATQKSLNRKVALKVMLRGGAAKEQEKARFKREMRILANVRHRYILPLYLAGIDGDLWWYTMKFVKGRSFKEALSSGQFLISKGARVLAKIARGMDFAHKNSVIHRDLKPQNVMLERDDSADENDANAREEPQILDFGLAKELDAQTMANLTQMGAFLGTPAYMAPEQAGGDPSQIDGRADIYSLGAMFYEVLTGRPPFTGKTPANILKQLLSEEPVPPRQVFPHAPAELEPIALKALKKNRDERYATAGEMADAIEAAIGPEKAEAPKPAASPEQPKGAPDQPSQQKKSLFGKLFGGG